MVDHSGAGYRSLREIGRDPMYTGECFCGEVKYEISGELFAMYCCHCSICRKMCGASFTTNGSVEANSFRVTHGREIPFSSLSVLFIHPDGLGSVFPGDESH